MSNNVHKLDTASQLTPRPVLNICMAHLFYEAFHHFKKYFFALSTFFEYHRLRLGGFVKGPNPSFSFTVPRPRRMLQYTCRDHGFGTAAIKHMSEACRILGGMVESG